MRRDARQDKDSRADDRTDAQARELDGPEAPAQPAITVQLFDQGFVTLSLKQLICHTPLCITTNSGPRSGPPRPSPIYRYTQEDNHEARTRILRLVQDQNRHDDQPRRYVQNRDDRISPRAVGAVGV